LTKINIKISLWGYFGGVTTRGNVKKQIKKDFVFVARTDVRGRELHARNKQSRWKVWIMMKSYLVAKNHV